ncbi:MAG: carboxypeptidase regulatory-like domain-containing protein [Rhodocyclaceae bacterium]|nr:carboxypeptidase regulatory-like domain-containing protein [Rhodocyclaceae bacterium]
MHTSQRHRVALIAALFAAGLAGTASAETFVTQSPSTVPYVSGGVGTGDQDAMRAQARDYNLRLTFAESGTGAYLANVYVDIRNDMRQHVLTTVTDGPYLMAQLPPGRYTLEATFNGVKQGRSFYVSRGQATNVSVYWPAG